MNQRTKTKCKRITCLLFALVIIAANAPVSPPAKATAGILPMPAPPSLPFIPHGGDMAYYQNPLVDGYDNADIFALIEATMAAQRAAGVQYVSDLGNGAYVPSEDAIGHMVESVTAVYNALDAVTQSELWQKAENIAEKWLSGAEHIAVSFGRNLLEKVVLKRLELYPSINEYLSNETLIQEIRNNPFFGTELDKTTGSSVNDTFYTEFYKVPVGWVFTYNGITNGQGYANGQYIIFDQNGWINDRLKDFPARRELVEGNQHIHIIYRPNNVNYPFVTIQPYYISTWYENREINIIHLAQIPDIPLEEFGMPAHVTNDAPEELPAEVIMTLPPAWTAPDFSEAFQRWKAINAMSGADVYSPPIPVPPGTDVWDGKAKADELRDLLWSIWTLLQGLLGFDRLLNGIKEFHDSIPERVTEAEYKEIRSRIETIEGMIDLINPGAMTEAETEAAAAAAEKAAADTKAGTDANTDAGTDNPAIPDTGVGSKVDFSPLLGIAFPAVFPFCLPWDVANVLTSFRAQSKEPIFHVSLPLLPGRAPVEFTLDLTVISPLMPMMRFFIVTLFTIGLIKLTPKLIRW